MIKSRTQKRVLVISTAAATVKGWLASAVGTNFIVEIHTATSGIEGFQKFTELRPDMVLVDDNLEDMNGMSFSAITKSTIQGDDVKILVYNVKQLLPYNKADEMLPAVNTQEELKSILSMVVKTFFEDLYIKTVYREEIEAKKIEQYNELPKPLSNNPYFDINYIFSPFEELSGDGFDYWVGNSGSSGLYGFLFDCTGHGNNSYALVGSIRSVLRKSVKLYQLQYLPNLGKLMEDVNFDVFNTSPGNEPSPTAAIVFYIDYQSEMLHYCSAGIPGFYIKGKMDTVYRQIECENPLIGFAPNEMLVDVIGDNPFVERQLKITDINEIIFSSDGFNEIVYHHDDLPKKMAKHDDVSAITIKLKRS